ncbi:protein DA1-related 1-like [Syzygium oleosum]|uniref:protein DA1-related 1-like n=1 Tax=Syzygium oleosum TaxID=219896 RepID=UPI0024B8ADBB|nr:protein DA1-related 1-like [Syzygium oleosum]
MDDQAFKALEHEIREFYEYLGMKVHQRTIPLYLVNEQEMKESKARDGKNGHHRLDGTYGRTTSYVHTMYTNVEGRRHTLVAHSRVVSIRVLYGLPRLFTGQILTHEMMHAWHVLEIDGYHNLSLEVKEGLCEVLAHTWLGSQIRSMSKSKAAPSPLFNFEKRLAKFLRHGIESRTDHPYGTGFQLVKRATDMYGLKGTLDYIRMTGVFPS